MIRHVSKEKGGINTARGNPVTSASASAASPVVDLSEKALRCGNFYYVNDLIGGIPEDMNQPNDDSTPCIWTASATDKLEKVKRARRALPS